MKLAAGNGRKRLKFFTLQDELAQRLVERATAGIGFAETEQPDQGVRDLVVGTPAFAAQFSGGHRSDARNAAPESRGR